MKTIRYLLPMVFLAAAWLSFHFLAKNEGIQPSSVREKNDSHLDSRSNAESNLDSTSSQQPLHSTPNSEISNARGKANAPRPLPNTEPPIGGQPATFFTKNAEHPLLNREVLDYRKVELSPWLVIEDFLVRNLENDQVETVAVERTWQWNDIQEQWVSGDIIMDSERLLLGGVDSQFLESIESELKGYGLSLERRLNHSQVYVLRLENAGPGDIRQAEAAIAALLLDSNQAYVETDHIAYPAAIPNDPLWDSQLWHMEKIEAHLAFDITEGDPRVVIAVADTGTRVTHEDLRNIVWQNPGEIPGNNLDDDGNGYVDDVNGWNVDGNNSDLTDVDGHGTHVGGTMGAEGNNGKGVVGVGWKHELMVFACGNGLSTSETADAMDYMTMMKTQFGVNIVSSNWSWGSLYENSSYTGSSTRRNSIIRARDVGILFVAAAGNDGKELEGTSDKDGDGNWFNHYPSSLTVLDNPNSGDWESVVSVAASTTSDGKAGFSNFGHGGPEPQVVDLAAPGAGIHSTYRSNDSNYRDLQGTSMASPHVAGAIGLISSANPSLPTKKVLEILYNGLDSPSTWVTRSEYQGRLNVFNSVQEANSYPHSEIMNLASDMVLPTGTSIEIVVNAWDTDGSVTEVRLYENSSSTPLATDSDGSDGWSFIWTPTDGVYDLHVAATDDEGKIANPGEDQDVANFRITNIQVGGHTVIVETGEGANSNGFSPSTSSSYIGFYGRDTLQSWQLTSGEFYTYEFQVPEDGNWDLDMWWPGNGSAASSVPFRVTDENGTTTYTLDQSTNSAQFNNVGSFDFNAGTTYTAEIYYTGSTVSGRIFADALRLTLPLASSDPLVSVVAQDLEIAESGSGTQLVFTRTSSTGALTVNLAVSGTATAGTDYTALPSTVSFADGESTTTLALVPIDELDVEGDETITVSIDSGTGYDALPIGGETTVTLTSEDLAGEFDFTVTSRSVSEGVGTFQLDVTRTNGASGAVSVQVATANGSATAGSDYTSLSQTLNWTHLDSSTQSVTLTVLEDSVYNEGNETFTVSLSGPTNSSSLGDDSSVTVSITENDINATPTITLDSPSSTRFGVPSGIGLFLETTPSDDGLFNPLTLAWSQISGPGTATFSSPTSDDTRVEFDQDGDYQLRLTANDGALDGTLDIFVTVGSAGDPGYQEDSGLVVIEAEVFDQSTAAGGKEWTVNTSLSDYLGSGLVTASPNTGTSVNSGYTGGGAARLDYQVNFATTGTYHVWVRGNSSSGSDDSVHVSLNDQVIATADRISISSNGSWSWGRNTMDSATASLDVSTAGLHTVNLYMREDGASVDRIVLTTDNSYNPGSSNPEVSSRGVRQGPDVNPGGPYTIPATLSLTLDATVTDDGYPEIPGSVSTSWSQVSGPGIATFVDSAIEDASVSFDTPGTYTLRLTANDGDQQTYAEVDVTVNPLGPIVLIQETGQSTDVAEGGATDEYSLMLGAEPTADVIVTISPDSKASVNPTSVTFTSSNWATPQTVTVTAIDDAVNQGDHSGTISHSASSADGDYDGISIDNLIINIADNDLPGILALTTSTATPNEGDGAVTLTVSRTGGSFGSASVNFATADGSSTAGADYTASSGTLTWSDGDSTDKDITIAIADDSDGEGPEDFTLTLSGASGASLGSPSQTTVTIQDNDFDIYLLNFGLTDYTSDGVNTWQSFNLTDQSAFDGTGDSVAITNATLVDSSGSTSAAIRFDSDISGSGTGNTAINEGLTEVQIGSDPYDWFDPSEEEQREYVVIRNGYEQSFTFSGFAITDVVDFEFVFARTKTGDRAVTVSYQSTGDIMDDLQVDEDGGPQYPSISSLTGSESYTFTFAMTGSAFGCLPNAMRIRVSDGGDFIPSTIPDLVAWYDAQSLSGADGTSISTWTDVTDAEVNTVADDLTQITSGTNAGTTPVAPTLQTVTLNTFNYRSVRFVDGASGEYELLKAADLVTTGDTDRTIVTVYKGGMASGGSRPLGFGSSLEEDVNGSKVVWNLGTDSNGSSRFDGAYIDGYSAGLSQTEYVLRVAAMESFTSFDEYIDVLDTNFADNQVLSNGNPNSSLGQIRGDFFVGDVQESSSGGDTGSTQYDILEVLVYDSALSSAQRQAIQEYLKTKYTTDPNPAVVPTAASSLGATTVSSTRIDLVWADNSNNETGFKVERSTTSGSGYSTVTTTAADAISYSDTSLSPGITYYYQIIATNGTGDSTSSNEDSATTWTLRQQFFSNHGLPHHINKDLDTDKDGFTNEQEYNAGTDPNSRSSAFSVGMSMPSPGNFRADLPTKSGRYYRVRYRDSLSGGAWTTLPGYENMSGTGSDVQINDTTSDARFYRIEVRPTPWE